MGKPWSEIVGRARGGELVGERSWGSAPARAVDGGERRGIGPDEDAEEGPAEGAEHHLQPERRHTTVSALSEGRPSGSSGQVRSSGRVAAAHRAAGGGANSVLIAREEGARGEVGCTDAQEKQRQRR